MSHCHKKSGLSFDIYGFILILLLVGQLCQAGQWIVPDPPEMLKGGLGEASFLGKSVEESPYIYRTVVTAPVGADMVCVALRSAGYAYIWIDGQCLTGRKVDVSDRDRKIAARNRILSADLTELLCDGSPHVLAVSAPREGFVMDGAFFQDFERVGSLVSSDEWTVTRFAPASVLENAPVMKLDYDKKELARKYSYAWPVRVLSSWSASDESFISTAQRLRSRQIYNRAVDIRTRLATFADSGDIIIDNIRSRWSGLVNTSVDSLRRAEFKLTQAEQLAAELKKIMAGVSRPDTDRISLAAKLGDLNEQLDSLDNWLAELAAEREKSAKSKVAALSGKIYSKHEDGKANLEKIPVSMKVSPLELNRSEDIYGWFEMPAAFDGDIGNWGIQINPLDKSSVGKVISLNGDWRFQCDITDVGLEIGANKGAKMDNWLTRAIPHNWARDTQSGIAAYEGLAWYGRRVHVPSQWAGMPVRFKFTVEGTERLWVNGREVSALGIGYRKRTYDLPPETIAYGSENLIIIQVNGQGAYRGMAGRASLSCPRLSGLANTEVPKVDISSSALSPIVMLRPHTDKLFIRHSGKAAMAIPQDGTVRVLRNYDRVQDRKLAANWVLIWMHPRNPWDVLRPVLLVFQHNPRLITCRDGVVEITLDRTGEMVAAVRPWSKRDTSINPEGIDLLGKAQLWSRLARAIPINFIALPAASDDGLKAATVVYDYLETDDDWATQPIRIAPMPALASVALNNSVQSFSVPDDQQIKTLHEGWFFGPYIAAVDTDRISYRFADTDRAALCAVSCDFVSKSNQDAYCTQAAELGFNALQWIYPYSTDRGAFRNFKPSTGPWPAEIAANLDMHYIHRCGALPRVTGKSTDQSSVDAYITAMGQSLDRVSEAIAAVGADSSFSIDLADKRELTIKRVQDIISRIKVNSEPAMFAVSSLNSNDYELEGNYAISCDIDLGKQMLYSLDTGVNYAVEDTSGYIDSITGEMITAAIEGKSLFVNILADGNIDSNTPRLLFGLADIFDGLGVSWSVGRPDLLFEIRGDGSVVPTWCAQALQRKLLQWHTGQ